MFLLRLIRNFVAILKSSQTPREIGLGVALGMFAGLAPLGAHTLFLVTAAMLLACSFNGFLYSFFFFKLFTRWVWNAGYFVGYVVLQGFGLLDPLWGWLCSLPVFGVCGFNRYTLLGSYLVAGALTTPVYLGTLWAVKKYRGPYTEFMEGSKLFQRFKQVFVFRWLRWIFLGGESRFLEPAKEEWILFRYVRKPMLLLLPVAFAAGWVLLGGVIHARLGAELAKQASAACGTTVTVKGAGFNIFSGTIRIRELTVKDPNDDKADLLRMEKARMDVGIVAALCGRLHARELRVGSLELLVRREADGSLNLDNVDDGRDDEDYRAWLAGDGAKQDWVALTRAWAEHLRLPQARALRESRNFTFDADASKPLPRYAPLAQIDKTLVERMTLTVADERKGNKRSLELTDCNLVILNASTSPILLGKPVSFDLNGLLGGDADSLYSLHGRWDFGESEQQGAIWHCVGVDLKVLAGFVQDWLPIHVKAGRASVAARLGSSGSQLIGEVGLTLSETDISAKIGGAFPFMEAAEVPLALRSANALTATAPMMLNFSIDGGFDKPDLSDFKRGLLRGIEPRLAELPEEDRAMMKVHLSNLPEAPAQSPRFSSFRQGLGALQKEALTRMEAADTVEEKRAAVEALLAQFAKDDAVPEPQGGE